MPTHLVFSARSLATCIERAPSSDWFVSVAIPDDGSWGVLAVTQPDATHIVHVNDHPTDARIVVLSGGDYALAPIAPDSLRSAYQRIHRVATQSQTPPLRLPTAWSQYHHNNFITFFANPIEVGNDRLIAEINIKNSNDVCIWSVTQRGEHIKLEEFSPPMREYESAVAAWADSLTASTHRLNSGNDPEKAPLQPTVDLDATTFGAVTKHRGYEAWIDDITEQQREFVFAPRTQSIKLRGPAGTGKTLALELKVLKELYDARRTGVPARILFVTHSWALAVQAEAGMRLLDPTLDIAQVDVYPLLAVADLILPPERRATGFRLLGEDNQEGKRLQIQMIDEIVENLRQGDWIVYRRGASNDVKNRVAAARGSSLRNGFVWDLMIEFSCVLSAHGILPGINAERDYLALHRAPWMMPLGTEADKRFVLRVYTEYVARLKQDALLASDQLINDFLNFLETFAWNLRRDKDGYDLIFVDELHLFNDQERLVLHYLTRSPDQYPVMFMALDARQSPTEVYDLAIEVPSRGVSSQAEELMGGTVKSLELSAVHRFTPQILRLVQHIHDMYPALNLGPDWELDVKALTSTVAPGGVPTLIRHQGIQDEIASSLTRAAYFSEHAGRDERIAVVVVDTMRLQQFIEFAETRHHLPITVVAGRDEVDNLRYSRRRVVLTAAEFSAGLQFTKVIVAGLPDTRGIANRGHELRRFLSSLYVAVSRATNEIEIHVAGAMGGTPQILETAIESKIMVLPPAKEGK